MATKLSQFTRMLLKTMRPLSKAEAKMTIAAAVEHLKPELEREGASRFRVLGAQLTATRPSEKERPRRLIEVIIVDYLNHRQVRVVVDGKRVVEERPLEFQPAYSPEELSEADAIARRDRILRTALRGRGVFVSAYAPGSTPPNERRIGLRWLREQKGGQTVMLGRAEVDLSEQRLVAAAAASKGR
jgi:hypothetical protein